LYMTCASQRMLFGRTSANRPSRFVGEIPPELVEQTAANLLAPDQDSREPWSYGAAQRKTATAGTYGGWHLPQTAGQRQSDQRRAAKAQAMAAAHSSALQAKPTQALPQLHKGDMLKHKAFGQGMVLSIQSVGGDALVEIAFDTVGTKRLMLKSAAQYMTKL
ncbi:MAG: ATP-dependent DNA helicase PcrA, partial [Oscillospiraceae bacterium]|nr:ATP-dependent DNA helicase PcrA [Oscillospiraceae bacterium]